MGNVVTANGLQPDEQKIVAIVDMPPPTDVLSVQRLLGMSRHLSQCTPNESTITASLRELLKKNADCEWTKVHDPVLQQLKTTVTHAPTLFFLFYLTYLSSIHEKAMYRYVLDGKSALAWELPYPGHLSST